MNDNLNFLAAVVIRSLEEIPGIGSGYIQEKCERLKDQDKMATLAWMNNLDDEVLNRVADRLEVSVMHLDIARKVARKL